MLVPALASTVLVPAFGSMVLDHAAIAARIPHQGNMCLLDTVVDWSETAISCSTSSHRDPANPLRTEGRLGAANGDLDRYLRFIRGDTREDMALGKLLKVADLPVRLVEGMKLDIFKAANKDANIF